MQVTRRVDLTALAFCYLWSASFAVYKFLVLFRKGPWKRGVIMTVWPTVLANPSRKRSFAKKLFKPEEFENVGFSFSSGQKTFWTRNLFENVVISRIEFFWNTNPKGPLIFMFWIPPAQCGRKTFDVFSERNLCFSISCGVVWTGLILFSRTSCGTYSLVLLTIISNLPKPLCTASFFLSCNRGYDGVVTFLPAPAVENSPQDKTRCRSGWVNRSVMHATCYLIGRTKKDGKKTCRPQAWRMKTYGALTNYDF